MVGRHGVARYRGARINRVNALARLISEVNLLATIVSVDLGLVSIWQIVCGDLEVVSDQRPTESAIA